MPQPLPAPLATRVRALLRQADHAPGAAGSAAEWRRSRDRWLDALDPSLPHDFGAGEVRELVDFLSESGPARSSRRSPAEWSTAVDALVPELLFAGH